MNSLEFLARIVEHLAWPTILLAIVIMFRPSLGKLVPLLERVKYKDLEFLFRGQLAEIGESLSTEQPTSDKIAELKALAEISPRSAIMETWREIESAARAKVGELGSLAEMNLRRSRSALRYLEYTGALTPRTKNALRQLRLLRDQAAHASEFALTSDVALEYATFARDIAHQISAISSLPRFKLTALTMLIFEYNALLDTGKYNDISVADVEHEIEKGTVLEYIEEVAGEDVDLSLVMTGSYPGFKEEYVKELQDLLGGDVGNEGRKGGGEKLGLSLLIAWTNEIIQKGSGWHPRERDGNA